MVAPAAGALAMRLDGRLVDDTGRPVAGGRVFELRGVAARAYDVFAHRDDRASAMTRVAVTDDDAAEVELVLHDAGIAGVVVDDRGLPVEGAEVCAKASDVNGDVTDSQGRFDLGAFPPGEYAVTASWPKQHDGRRCGEERTTVVDRAGRFQLELLPPGDYEIELIVPSRDPIVARTTTTVAAGQRAAVGLVLPPRR